MTDQAKTITELRKQIKVLKAKLATEALAIALIEEAGFNCQAATNSYWLATRWNPGRKMVIEEGK